MFVVFSPGRMTMIVTMLMAMVWLHFFPSTVDFFFLVDEEEKFTAMFA